MNDVSLVSGFNGFVECWEKANADFFVIFTKQNFIGALWAFFIKRDPALSCGAIFSRSLVPYILSLCRVAKIVSSIIETISVDVIYKFTGRRRPSEFSFSNQYVKKKILTVLSTVFPGFGSRLIASHISEGFIPNPLLKQIFVNFIDNHLKKTLRVEGVCHRLCL